MLFYLFTGSGTVAVSSFLHFQPNSYLFPRAFLGSAPTPLTGSDLPQSRLTKYISEIQEQQVQHADSVSYWAARRASCESLADLALDLLAAPASQAYIERFFLLVGC